MGIMGFNSFCIGNMVGGGVFMLPANLAHVSGPMGSTLAWSITGLGVFMIALVFGNLANQTRIKSWTTKLCSSDVPFKKAGKVAGYSMAWGYWAVNWAATASVIISFAGYLSTFLPVLQSKQILFSMNGFSLELGKGLTFLVCSLMLWGIQYILSQNIDRAGNMNLLATIAKKLSDLQCLL